MRRAEQVHRETEQRHATAMKALLLVLRGKDVCSITASLQNWHTARLKGSHALEVRASVTLVFSHMGGWWQIEQCNEARERTVRLTKHDAAVAMFRSELAKINAGIHMLYERD